MVVVRRIKNFDHAEACAVRGLSAENNVFCTCCGASLARIERSVRTARQVGETIPGTAGTD